MCVALSIAPKSATLSTPPLPFQTREGVFFATTPIRHIENLRFRIATISCAVIVQAKTDYPFHLHV